VRGGFFLAALLGALLLNCKGGSADTEPAPEPKREDGVDVTLSPRSIAAIKLQTAKPSMVPRRSSLSVAGAVDFVPSHVARIGPQIAGRIGAIRVAPGQAVTRGAVLSTLDSVDIGRARADYAEAESRAALAATEFARERRMLDAGASSERSLQTATTELQVAKTSVKAAGDRLRTLGAGASATGTSSLPLTSPIDGKVLEMSARIGQPVGPTDTLFVVGDTQEVWLAVDIYERDLAKVKVGDDVVASAVAFPGRAFPGKVDQLGTVVDPARHVLEGRIVLENPDGSLRPGMMASARILGVPEAGAPPVVSVPRAAVQAIDGQPFVFVEQAPGKYQLRAVERGVELEDGIEIRQGLASTETIVTEGSFILKSEVLRAQMGTND
jgi:cobalt-zinc-cadmium efflux system membrane fusion protein